MGAASSPLCILGLLVCPDREERPINFGSGDPVDVYLRCAGLASASFRAAGYDYTLVSDDPARLALRAGQLGIEGLAIEGFAFALDVPSGIAFRAAHHKLELLGAMGAGRFGPRAALVDLDVVCLRPLPSAIAEADAVAGYDITAAMVGPLGAGPVAEALSLLHGSPVPPQWWGGEFVCGPSPRLTELAEAVRQIWPRYTANLAAMPHQGDEMVLTAAFQALGETRRPGLDGGAAGAIARYWSARTRHCPQPFAEAARAAILHLPADKDFLAAYPLAGFDAGDFLAAYRRMLRRKIAGRRVLAWAERLRRGPRRYPPRL